MTSQPHESNLPEPEYDGLLIFLGRTGVGLDVEVREVDGWLDVRYIDRAGEVRGFSLNQRYAGALTRALVAAMVRRADSAPIVPGEPVPS